MKLSVRYRNLRPDDYHSLYKIWTETPGLTTRKADTQEGYNSFLRRNPGLSFGAEIDGKLIGGILGGHDGRFGSIHHLVVLPKYRKQGIGKRLVELCLDKIKAAGMEKCHIFINGDNPEGLKFWIENNWIERVELVMASYIF
jgi:putative acetyltransferase